MSLFVFRALNASGWSAKAETIDAMKARGLTRMGGSSIDSVTVPGAVAGWQALHAKFGKLPLAADLAPAIALAENGFPVTETDSANWSEYGMHFKDRLRLPVFFCLRGPILAWDRCSAIPTSPTVSA